MDGSRPGILHLVSNFHSGGSERQALQLVGLLHSTGRYRLHMASLRRDGALRREAEELLGQIPDYPIASFHDRHALGQVRRFAAALRRERIAVVQTHDFYSNVFGMAGSALARTPVRIAARRETEGTRTPSQKIVERLAYRFAHTIVVNADAVGRRLADEGVNSHKIVTVHNGVRAEAFGPSVTFDRRRAQTRFGLPARDRDRYVTLVANMRSVVKDHATFLRAARSVVSAYPDAVFLLAGEGDLQPSIRALAGEMGLESRAVFLGSCDSISDLLALSTVCVLSSRAEGFPNAVLEYMAAGRAVVATDVGGVREAITDGTNGFIVPVGDAAGMAQRILELLRDEALAASMGTRSRDVVQERFSSEALLARTEALYHRLLGAGSN